MSDNNIDASMGRLPDFIVIGEMRCGSTSIWEMLDRHSQIYFSPEKELHFFDGRSQRWEKGADWYRSNFKEAGEEMVIGEATPDYLFHEAACERIHETVPKAKLIVILRDPVQRAWSHYWHNVRRGRETLTFRQAMEQEEGRMKDPDLDIRSHYSYSTRGHYLDRLEVFEKKFGKESLCVVFLEDLKKDPMKTMSQVCAHIGIEYETEMATSGPPERNKASYPTWPKLNAKLQSLMRFAKKTKILAVPATLISRMTRPFRTYSGQTRMESDLEKELRQRYRESDQRLGEWLGRPVPWRKVADKNKTV